MSITRICRSMPVVLLLGTFPAAAEGYCVACYEPDAVYRCIVEGSPEAASPDPAHQVQCIKELAVEGKHARCSVERFSAAGCNGPVKVISPATIETPLKPGGNTAGEVPPEAAPTVDASGPPPQSTDEKPPRTVEELAKSTAASTKKGLDDVTETVKSSTKKAGDQIEGAGSAIGSAAKKTWNCLSSFFSDC